jgi:hypothetical protein
MRQTEYQRFLDEVASPEVPFGIYAVEKNGISQLVLEKCDSITQLKKKTQEYRKQGFKVYSNGR